MADIFDQFEENYQSGGAAPAGDMFDQFEQNYQANTPSFLERTGSAVLRSPVTAYEMVKSIPSGVSNVFQSIFNPVEAFESGTTEKTVRGVGTLASGAAGASVGATLGAFGGPLAPVTIPLGIAAGGAFGPAIFDAINELTGSDEKRSFEERKDVFAENLGAGIGLAGLAKGAAVGTKAVAKAAPKIASAMDRKSLGTRQSDYGKASDVRTIDTPEGGVETYVKSALDSILEKNELGLTRDPAKLIKRVEQKSAPIKNEIGTIIKNYDENAGIPVEPDFSNALQYLYSGKVPADLMPRYINRLDQLDQNIRSEGQGKLSFLQQQKIAMGKAYDAGDQVLAGFNRAIYTDLKNRIEYYAPEVGPLNKQLAPYEIVEPIIYRSLKAAENKDLATTIRDFGYTTGGIGAPTLAGSILGGPVGAVAGATVGVTGKALASPTGKAVLARGARGVGKAASKLDTIFDAIFAPPKKAAGTVDEGAGGVGGPGDGGPGGGGPVSAISQLFDERPATKAAGMFDDVERSAPPEYAHIETEAINKLKSEGPALIEQYIKENTNHNGTLKLDTDLGRPYVSDSKISQGTHEAASSLVKAVAKIALDDPAKPRVAILSGGPSSGKTTAAAKFDAADILFDKIVKSEKAGSELIDRALNKGKSVEFQFVYAKPEIALERAWNRALGSDRAVPVEHFAQRALETTQAAVEIAKKYGADDRVTFRAVDNSDPNFNPRSIGIDEIEKIAYNHGVEGRQALEARLRLQLKNLYDNTKQQNPGKIDSIYKQFAGEEAPRNQGGTRGPGGSTPATDDRINPRGGQENPRGTESRYPVTEVPVDDIKLSSEVRNFKAGANERGVVEPLKGQFERRGLGPIAVWERLDGSKEIISGRHRWDLAKRSGESTIPAQVYRESEGFTASDARRLDAELNIIKERGAVSDYAKYFKEAKISEAGALERGFLSRAKGRAGFAIGTKSSEELFSLYSAGKLNERQAQAIAEAAPNNAALQRAAIVLTKKGASSEDISSLLDELKEQAGGAGDSQIDMFGANDQYIKAAVQKSKLAEGHRSSINEEIRAVQNAARNPRAAAKYGINVKDPESILKKVEELKIERDKWESWGNYPELREQLNKEMGAKQQGASQGSAISKVFEKKAGDKTTMDEVFSKNDVKAVEAQIDADPFYSALYEAESGRNPTAKNPESSAKGGFQFINSTARGIGLKDPLDLGQAFEAVQRLTNKHKSRFGDDPADLYSAHYLGETVFAKLKRGAKLTDKESAQVEYLEQKALPRFMRIYNKLASKTLEA